MRPRLCFKDNKTNFNISNFIRNFFSVDETLAPLPAFSDGDDDDLKGIVLIDMYNFIGVLSNTASKEVEVACQLVEEEVPVFPKKLIKPYKRKTKASKDMALFTLKKAYVPLVMLKRLRTLRQFITDAQSKNLQNIVKKMVHNSKMAVFNLDYDESD